MGTRVDFYVVLFMQAVECSGQKLVPITTNLVDEVWPERPPRPAGPLMVLPLDYTGKLTHGS